MKAITQANPTELETRLSDRMKQYRILCSEKHTFNMARGKPGIHQLDLSSPILGELTSYTTENGTDARNYGILDGIPECRRLFGELLDLEPDHMIIGGNSSLNMMFDTLAFLCLFGIRGKAPWCSFKYQGNPVKFLCPVPGYDRHFAICEELGIEMIPVPLREDGPDMDMVKELAGKDPLVKGIWCVPLHSNPQGICYSDHVVRELASMKTAAEDFRIFWDNAYGIHHLYEEVPLKNILKECKKYGNPERAYYFFSTSKITLPGAGLALVSSGSENIQELKKHMSAQTIGHDKLNQLRHLRFFKNPENIRHHMHRLADLLRPKFDIVLDVLSKDLGGSGLASWSIPKGGYFISLNTLPGCAKRTVELAKHAGVTLTAAGATYPYGNDPKDSNIRIAPSYPEKDELKTAMSILTLCIQIAGIEKLLEEHHIYTEKRVS